jgi:hypothetical protein
LSLEQCDLVLQKKLAFLEPLQLELILGGALAQLRNYVIEISVLYLQVIDLQLQRLDVGGMYHGKRPPYQRLRIQYKPRNPKKRASPLAPLANGSTVVP